MVFHFPSAALVPFPILIALSSRKSEGLMRGISQASVDIITSDMKRVGLVKEKFGRPTINLSCDETHANFRTYFVPIESKAVKIINSDENILNLDGLLVLRIVSNLLDTIQFSDGRHRIISCGKAFGDELYDSHVLCSITTFKDPIEMALDSYRKSEERPVVFDSIHDALSCFNVEAKRALNMLVLKENVRKNLGLQRQSHIDLFCKLLLHLFPKAKTLLDVYRDSTIFSKRSIYGRFGKTFVSLMQESGRVHMSCYRYNLSRTLCDLGCKEELQVTCIRLCNAVSRNCLNIRDRPRALGRICQSILDLLKEKDRASKPLKRKDIPELLAFSLKRINHAPDHFEETHLIASLASTFANEKGSRDFFQRIFKQGEKRVNTTEQDDPRHQIVSSPINQYEEIRPNHISSETLRPCLPPNMEEGDINNDAFEKEQITGVSAEHIVQNHRALPYPESQITSHIRSLSETSPARHCHEEMGSDTESLLCIPQESCAKASTASPESCAKDNNTVEPSIEEILPVRNKVRKSRPSFSLSGRRGKRSKNVYEDNALRNMINVLSADGDYGEDCAFKKKLPAIQPEESPSGEVAMSDQLLRESRSSLSYVQALCAFKCLKLANRILSRVHSVCMESLKRNSVRAEDAAQKKNHESIVLFDDSCNSQCTISSALSFVLECVSEISYIISVTKDRHNKIRDIAPDMHVVSSGILKFLSKNTASGFNEVYVTVYAADDLCWRGPDLFHDTYRCTDNFSTVISEFVKVLTTRIDSKRAHSRYIFDFLLHSDCILEIFLQFDAFHSYYMFFTKEQNDVGRRRKCSVILRNHVLKSCDCGGHGLLNTENEYKFNEFNDGTDRNGEREKPSFFLSASTDDVFPSRRVFAHNSLYLGGAQGGTTDFLAFDITICGLAKNYKTDHSIQKGLFASERSLGILAGYTESLEILYPQYDLVDSLNEKVNISDENLKSIDLSDLFVSGMTCRKLNLRFPKWSAASAISHDPNGLKVDLIRRYLDFQYLKKLYQAGFGAVKTKEMSLVCFSLKPGAPNNGSEMLQCPDCGAFELLLSYTSQLG